MAIEPSMHWAHLSAEEKQARSFGVLALLWGIYPLGDYLLTYFIGYPYLKFTMSDEMIVSFAEMGAHILFAWYFMVFGLLAGAILLIRLSRHAVWSFAASAAGSTWSNLDTALLNPVVAMDIPFMLRAIGAALIFGIYAWVMRRRGVLR